jgi:hypothetical protein
MVLKLLLLKSCYYYYCKIQQPIPLQVAALICNFGITELLFHKNGNMMLRSTGGTTAAVCGYGNTDYD